MAESDQSTDQVFVELYDDLGDLAHDIKALEFKLRKLAKRLMQRRAVFERALKVAGIKFVDRTAQHREEHS